MAAKVTFDPATREINVTQAPVNGIINLNVKVDLYSDGKEDWLADPTLQKMRFPIRPIGGDPIPIGVLGETYILENGWYIHPYEADHEFVIVGNLFTEGEELVADTTGAYRVKVTQQVSTLVEVRVEQTMAADLARLRKIMQNRMETDPNTGIMTIYDDDGTTVLLQWNIWEDVGASQAYRSQGIERRDAPT